MDEARNALSALRNNDAVGAAASLLCLLGEIAGCDQADVDLNECTGVIMTVWEKLHCFIEESEKYYSIIADAIGKEERT